MILQCEAKIPVARKTFVVNGFSYPLSFVAFEHQSRLGFFDPAFLEIGVNKCLMVYEETFLKEVLRHELAHYLTYITYGNQDRPHGETFSKICKKHGWDKEKKALLPIDTALSRKKEEAAIKVEKLLQLSKSGNVHEATSALKMAQHLICKHGVNYTESDSTFHVKRVLKSAKTTQKMIAISDILRQFFVYPVICHSKEGVYLEIFGKEKEIAFAEYIVFFLDKELEILWTNEKKKNPHLSGSRGKGSFFQGIAKGFIHKSKEDTSFQKALIVSEKKLQENIFMAYPHLSKKKQQGRFDKNALLSGEAVGANMNIHQPISERKKNVFLTYQK